jgi:hypothetical protein
VSAVRTGHFFDSGQDNLLSIAKGCGIRHGALRVFGREREAKMLRMGFAVECSGEQEGC